MEQDKLPTIPSILASTVPDEFTFKDAEHLKNCIQNRIRQLQTEICNLESQIKSSEGNGVLNYGSDTDEKAAFEEQKRNSLKVEENVLKSQIANLMSNMSLLEDATLELRLKINNIKENVRDCFVSKYNSESSKTKIVKGSDNLAMPDLSNEKDQQSGIYSSSFEGGNSNVSPALITSGLQNTKKKARLNFANENKKTGNKTVSDCEKEQVGYKLSQDELELIFKHSFITTADLLNFRCVNSTWRDAATSILLIRDSCQLILQLKYMAEVDKNNQQKAVYCKRHPFKLFPLTDLLPIIRASRKFPTTSLSFPDNSTLGRTLLPIFRDQEELLQFFTLYGKFIKSVFIGVAISKMELMDLLSEYTPNLECLSFQSLECISGIIRRNLFSQVTSESDREICSSLKVISTGPFSTIGVESIRWSLNLKTLLDMASNLQSIKNVPLELTTILVKEQKVHLLKELNFAPCEDRDDELDDYPSPKMIQLISDLVTMNPKLSVLNVVFDNVNEENYTVVISALNSLLESSKDTLECFKMAINPFDFPCKIIFPILKNLRHIEFTESSKTLRSGMEDPVFEFPEATGRHELFPKLYKVKLDSVRHFDVERTFMRFFPYNLSNEEDGPRTDDCVPSVKVLEISHRQWMSIPSALSMSRLFPNIKYLTLEIGCNFERNFENSVWLLCPLAESVEIIVRRRSRKYIETVEAVDSFFTGFTSELCAKLQKTDSPLNYKKDKKIIQFLRVLPSICDLQNLKFLTVRFLKLTSPFISTVSCLYAFKQMPETKVTFTCDSNVGICDRKQMQSCLFNVEGLVNFDLGIDTTSDDILMDCDLSIEEDAHEDIHGADTDSDSDAISTSSMDSHSD